jgi:sortase A
LGAKRIFLVVVALLAVFALSACSNSGEEGSTTQGGESTSKQAEGSTGKQRDGMEPASNKNMKLTIPKLERVKNTTVYNAALKNEQKYRKSVVHPKDTGFPWQEEANVYIAGHRLGYPNTGSFLIFYELDKLEKGDSIEITDSEGRKYTYKVYEKKVVAPTAVEVLDPVEGKNVVTLQTCTLPDYSKRLIVRGELKS